MALIVRAPAKVNLGLEVLGRRSDGYHEIVTILQTIDLADQLAFELAADLALETDHPGLARAEENLVLKAARLLRGAAGLDQGARIRLEKRIPVAAGLGGGSADAAATLRTLNELWELRWPIERLLALARQIGTDVAFCLTGGTQLATGRGDRLEPLPTPPVAMVLVPIAAPDPDKTRRLYGALGPSDWSSGDVVRAAADALRAGRPISPGRLPSAFQRATLALYPSVTVAWGALLQAGGNPVLSGAGPSLVSLHPTTDAAAAVAERLRSSGIEARLVRPLPRGEQASAP